MHGEVIYIYIYILSERGIIYYIWLLEKTQLWRRRGGAAARRRGAYQTPNFPKNKQADETPY